MHGTLDIAKLGLAISIVGVGVHGECHLQQLVLLLPVDAGAEVQAHIIVTQYDQLGQLGNTQLLFHQQTCAIFIGKGLDAGGSIQLHGEIFIHTAHFPGIVAGVHVLVHQETVTRACQVFGVAAGLFDADEFALGINDAAQILVFQHPAFFAGRYHRGAAAFPCGDGGGALGGDLCAIDSDGPAVRIMHCLGFITQHFAQQTVAAIHHFLQFLLGSFVNPGNGAAGGNIVEMIQKQQLPQTLQFLCPFPGNGLAGQQPAGQCVFRLLQRDLCLADATLGLGLGGKGATVPGQVQFATEGVFHIFLPLEELDGMLHTAAGSAFQVSAAADHFQHLTGRTATAITVTEGEDQTIDVLLLDTVLLPTGDQLAGGEDSVASSEKVGQHLCAVDAFPPEYIVGEGFCLGVLAGQLLGGKIGHLALLHDLRQCAIKAEGIGHPGHLAIHTQFAAEPALTLHKLADQAFTGGNIGVKFHPKRAFGIEIAAAHLLQDTVVHIGVKLLEPLQNRRLAKQERILGVLLHQSQLIGVGSCGFAHSLFQSPQPGQVQVGLTENGVLGSGGAVFAFEQRLQHLAGLHHRGGQFRLGQLKIRNVGKFL